MLFGFKHREVAVQLRDMATSPGDGLEGDPGLRHTDAYIFRAPSGGIPGRSGTTLGSAVCDAFFINDSDELETLTDSESTQITQKVLNMSTAAVAPNAYLQVLDINGVFVANWEDCA